MSDSSDALREHLVRVLAWEEAHVGFDKAVDGIPANLRDVRPAGFEHSSWHLLEHMRIAQGDVLDFCTKADYAHAMTWPEDYWPSASAPLDDKAWTDSIASFAHAREELTRLVRHVEDLTAPVPTGKRAQTYLRAILLVADHTAYHLGELVVVRRLLGVWKAA